VIPTLRVNNLAKSFGGLRAVSGISLEVCPGEVLSVIGPNGAGKTTLFNCLSGVYQPNEGEIVLERRSIRGLAPHIICRRGLSRTFQNIRLFGEMTAKENIMACQVRLEKPLPWDVLFRTPQFFRREKASEDEALNLLRMVGLEKEEETWARNLPYGFQRRLEIARALATKPRVLLLDEPGAGMNPNEVSEISNLICQIKKMGLAILLIEHHMKVVMDLSDRIVVLDHGEKIAEGTPEEIRNHPAVIAAYLGKEN